ncbi:MAG: hypothetical protein NVS9B15_20730 [Acidobacteriaceae bacterium]
MIRVLNGWLVEHQFRNFVGSIGSFEGSQSTERVAKDGHLAGPRVDHRDNVLYFLLQRVLW